MKQKLLLWLGILTTTAVATASQVNTDDIVNVLIEEGHISAECVENVSSKDALLELRQETGKDGKIEYIAAGIHACTCGAGLCFEWVYTYEGGKVRLKDSYMLMR